MNAFSDKTLNNELRVYIYQNVGDTKALKGLD